MVICEGVGHEHDGGVVGLDEAPEQDVLTRPFTVPADWTDGDVELWAVGLYTSQFTEAALAIHLDGKEIRREMRGGVCGLVLPVQAGETHELTFTLSRDAHPRVRGFFGPVYLYCRPHPAQTLDLGGTWEALADFTGSRAAPVTLPGEYKSACALRRQVVVPADWKGRRVRIDFASRKDRLVGVIVNGRYIRRHHHRFGDRTWLDITPFLRFGEANELILVGNTAPGQNGIVDFVRLLQF